MCDFYCASFVVSKNKTCLVVALVCHLAVVEKENVLIDRGGRLLEEALEAVSPLLEAVVFAHLELVELVPGDVSGQAGQGLASRPAHTNQQHVGLGLKRAGNY